MNNTGAILVVDDDPGILSLFTLILRRAGHEVWNASSGQEGLLVVRQKRPDLVLLDVLLPDLDGRDLCKQIKDDPQLPGVFVVLISGGATNPSQKVAGLESGADDYIIKPISPDELLVRVRMMLRLKHSTAALRASEEHHRRLLEILPDAVCLLRPDGQLLAANAQAVNILGYSAQELLQKSVFDLTPPGEHEQIATGIRTVLQSGTIASAEYVLRKKNGVPVQIESSATVTLDANGQPSGLVVVGRDITERKQAGEKIRQLLNLLDHAYDAITVCDLEEQIQYFNKGAERLLGWTAGEATGRRMTDLLFQDASAFSAAREKLYRHGEWSGELPAATKSGKPLILHSQWTLVSGQAGEPPQVVTISTDITKQKQIELAQKEVEAALRSAEARYRSIFENATEGIFRTTVEGRLLIANPALARMFGYQSPKELMSSLADVGKLYVPPEERDKLKRVVLEQGSVQGFEAENYRKDGSKIWISVNAHLVRQGDDAPACFEGTIQDITERKWAERFLQLQRDFGIFLSLSIDIHTTAVRLLELALQHEGIDCGGVFLVQPDTGTLDLVASRGFSAGFAKRAAHFAGKREPASGGPRPAASSQPAGPLGRLIHELKRERLLAMDVIPVQHRGEVVAVLGVGSRAHREIPAPSCQALEVIAARAAGAIARIRVEQSLRANRRLLERTLHSLPLAVFVEKADTNVIEECNLATTHTFGYRRDELIGQTTAFLHVNDAMAKQFADVVHSAIRTQGFLSDFECQLKRKDNSIFPAEYGVMPIRDEAGQMVSRVNVVQDITDRKRADEELRRLPRRIIEAQETERQRVAREIHDGVNQVIASVKMRLLQLAGCAPLNPAAREILGRCDKLLVQVLEENRRIAHNLRPSDLDELGLAAACRNFCKELQARTNLTVKCYLSPLRQPLPPDVDLNLFRIVQEALTNVEKHAQAKTVRVRLLLSNGSVVMKIQDDGCGFVRHRPGAGRGKRLGLGLTNMRERALSLGGTCEVLSAPEKGTTINVRIPCPPGGSQAGDEVTSLKSDHK